MKNSFRNNFNNNKNNNYNDIDNDLLNSNPFLLPSSNKSSKTKNGKG